MYLKLDGHGPLYAQLIRAMKVAILEGSLPAGSKLPSTRKLAEDFGVSRMTAMSAYEQLCAEGYIRGKTGSGSFVNALPIEPRLAALDKRPVAPQSRFAQRVRAARSGGDWPTPTGRGLRFELLRGMRITDPTLGRAWGRELSVAAQHIHETSVADPQGLPALREQVCVHLGRRRGVRVGPDDVVITNGAQQAFELTARVLLDEGDAVAVEEPHYYGMWEAFAAHGARLQPVPTDGEGLVCSALPKHAPKLVCVTPSHQYPAGPAMSLPRRLELLRYAHSEQCWILEDDYDSEFRYDSRPLAALRELDDGNSVVYVGTFSKILFGGLRLGYLIPPASLRQDFIDARCLCDLSGSSLIEQAAMASFMRKGGCDRQVQRKDKTMRALRKTILDALEQHASDGLRVSDFHTGARVVVWFPGFSHAQLDALIAHAGERGLGLYPVASHYHTPPATPALLLSFGGLSVPELREAMRIFGDCLDAVVAKPKRLRGARLRPAILKTG